MPRKTASRFRLKRSVGISLLELKQETKQEVALTRCTSQPGFNLKKHERADQISQFFFAIIAPGLVEAARMS